jgi:hypothetical protein
MAFLFFDGDKMAASKYKWNYILTKNIIINENPALNVQKLVKQIETILSQAGVSPVLLKSTEGKGNALDAITKVINDSAFRKLVPNYEKIVDIVAEIIVLSEGEDFSHLTMPNIPNLGHDIQDNLKEFVNYTISIKNTIQSMVNNEIGNTNNSQFLSAINLKKKKLDKGFFYEFSTGDLSRIQVLINELREQITASELFDNGHKQRLLRRLEVMQSEMHKKMSDVDRIWGLIGDAGIVLGKFGKDAKPIVDRIKEMTKIAWNTQARAEELPSSSQNPLLGHEEDI